MQRRVPSGRDHGQAVLERNLPCLVAARKASLPGRSTRWDGVTGPNHPPALPDPCPRAAPGTDEPKRHQPAHQALSCFTSWQHCQEFLAQQLPVHRQKCPSYGPTPALQHLPPGGNSLSCFLLATAFSSTILQLYVAELEESLATEQGFIRRGCGHQWSRTG